MGSKPRSRRLRLVNEAGLADNRAAPVSLFVCYVVVSSDPTAYRAVITWRVVPGVETYEVYRNGDLYAATSDNSLSVPNEEARFSVVSVDKRVGLRSERSDLLVVQHIGSRTG